MYKFAEVIHIISFESSLLLSIRDYSNFLIIISFYACWSQLDVNMHTICSTSVLFQTTKWLYNVEHANIRHV